MSIAHGQPPVNRLRAKNPDPGVGQAWPTPAQPSGASTEDARVMAIDAVLPQTQCGQCGFGGCLPYARALAAGLAPINRCPPGGQAGVADLARLLGQPVIALDPACGVTRPLHVAYIVESLCIGCTLCIQACPVDAIVGAAKAMHTVVAAECTGCDLCLAPCPMDCIQMLPMQPSRAWTRADADLARRRLHEKNRRLERERAENDERLTVKALHKLNELDARADLVQAEIARRKAIVESALARVRQRRAQATATDAATDAARQAATNAGTDADSASDATSPGNPRGPR
jgi:electron transport complex protein RnfB